MRPSRFLVVMFFSLGTLLFLDSSSHGQTVTSLYSFPGHASAEPGSVVPSQGRDGRLYGTTVGVGTSGTIFAITTTGVATSPYTFGTDGATPWGGLTLGTDGNYYGTASAGGADGGGVLFRFSPNGTYTDLHDFLSGLDGESPYVPPIQASDSKFYGVIEGNGGSAIYRYDPNGTFAVIYNFVNATGRQVASSVIQGSDGNLYGTANLGGTSHCGTIFKLSTSGVMLWTYSFPCGAGGGFPISSLMQASDGNYYGTTQVGGVGYGTVFKLDQSGDVSVLYSFKSTDSGFPIAGLTQGTDGNLYSTTEVGGTAGKGSLIQLTTSGIYRMLYSFEGVGQRPLAAPMQHTNGLFYGTTYGGGRFDFGAVYSLDLGLGPFITFVQPTGRVGRTAQILGQGLTGTTSVTFNGVPATSFSVASDTYMTAVVPSGAATGKVVVTTPGGALTSNVNFRIIH